MKMIILSLLLIGSPLKAGQQYSNDSVLFTSHVFNENIKTVQLYKEGWNLSYPIIKTGTDEKLILNFDLMGDNIETYYYTFIHCSKDWEKSDIFPNDYLEGFPENQIEDYEHSFNTTVNYIHYRVTFPNNRIQFKLSGNYLLMVYRPDKPDEPVLTQRFVVTEDAVNIKSSAHRPQMSKDKDLNQQIDFNVEFKGLTFTDPYRNVYAFLLQNGRWDIAKRNMKPDFFGINELKYNSLSDKNIFPGGNEFRYFDIKSIRYQSEFIKKIDYVIPNYNVYLWPSENREFKPYFYWQDFNGKYFVAIQEGKKPDIDADYVYVYFTLPSKEEIRGGSMYVSGGLNNWEFNKYNKMTYNRERREYECTMQLKQGWYNYEYVFMKDGSTRAVPGAFESSHYETENDYVVLIYYRSPHGRFDRVIGTSVTNTLNRMIN